MIREGSKTLRMLEGPGAVPSIGQAGDWACSDTTTKEPGKPEVVIATHCWSGARIELQAPPK